MNRWRASVALGGALALGALGASGVAFGGSSTEGSAAQAAGEAGVVPLQSGKPDAAVDVRGRVQPRRLPRQRFRNVQMFASVDHDNADGSAGVPKYTKAIRIDFGRNVRFRPNRPPKCRAVLEGTTTQEARQLCRPRSIIGTGTAHVRLPGTPPFNVTDVQTLAIAGPGRNQIRFHAFSPTLGSAVTQVIPARIRRGAPGKRFRWRLAVPEVPLILGGAGSNTQFGVTIRRNTGVVQARCGMRRHLWRAIWTFEDDTRNRDFERQRCRRR
jgi:hypothetical protein